VKQTSTSIEIAAALKDLDYASKAYLENRTIENYNLWAQQMRRVDEAEKAAAAAGSREENKCQS